MLRTQRVLVFGVLVLALGEEQCVTSSEECDLQVELIQTASILYSVDESLRSDAFEDAELSAQPHVQPPTSLLRALLSASQARLKDEVPGNGTASTNSTNSTTGNGTGSSSATVVPQNGLVVLGTSIGTSLVVVLLVFMSFGCLRTQFPAVYGNKALEPGSHGHLPPELSGCLDWLPVCWSFPVDDIANHSNLDHGMLIQFCDAAIMCLLSTGLPALLILCPIYAFAGGGLPASLAMFSFSNVAKGSWATYAAPFFVWYTVIVTQAFIFRAQRAFVQRRFQWLRTMPEPRATSVLLSNLPDDLCKDQALREFLQEQIFGSEGGRQVVKTVDFLKDTSLLGPLIKERERHAEELQKIVQGTAHERRKAVAGAELKKVDAQVAKQQEIIAKSDEHNQNVVFVTFEDRHDAVIVLKLFAPGGNEDIVAELPPDPDDIIWRDLAPPASQRFWTLFGVVLLVLLFVLFIPVVVVISGASHAASFQSHYASVAHWAKRNQAAPIFWDALVGPALLNFFMSILCSIMASIICTFFVLKARGMLQYMLQRWYYVYLAIFVLLIASVGTSLSSTISYLLKNPKEILTVLPEAFPGCTLFYMNYVAWSWGIQALALLRAMTLLRYFLLSLTFEDPKVVIARAEPEDQDYNGMGSRSARLTLIYVVVLVFGTLAPLITLLGAIFFAFCRIFYTYLFVYAETLKPDLGGLFWHQQLKHAQQATFLYIAVMTGLLLNRGPNIAPGILCASSAIFMAFSYYTFLSKFRWQQLEFSEIPKIAEGAAGAPPRRVYGHYRQPELPHRVPKEATALRRAATTMRQRFNVCGCDDDSPQGSARDKEYRTAKTERRIRPEREERRPGERTKTWAPGTAGHS
ncbi:unnamed protein product [Effrenium voratum]|uniref:CSC1/OSCA1-like 7TM region domain-containing protein n=1 Tax=Effrenium voratum TaxID=2562239 RepID=A0AA36IYF5_9DINO|nr:unnamed protein product [Effrenium voratum]